MVTTVFQNTASLQGICQCIRLLREGPCGTRLVGRAKRSGFRFARTTATRTPRNQGEIIYTCLTLDGRASFEGERHHVCSSTFTAPFIGPRATWRCSRQANNKTRFACKGAQLRVKHCHRWRRPWSGPRHWNGRRFGFFFCWQLGLMTAGRHTDGLFLYIVYNPRQSTFCLLILLSNSFWLFRSLSSFSPERLFRRRAHRSFPIRQVRHHDITIPRAFLLRPSSCLLPKFPSFPPSPSSSSSLPPSFLHCPPVPLLQRPSPDIFSCACRLTTVSSRRPVPIPDLD